MVATALASVNIGGEHVRNESTIRRIRAVLFDLDDTLLDGASFARSIVLTCEHITERVPHLDVARLQQANATAFQQYWPEIARAWTHGYVSGRDVTLETWRRTLEECGCDDDDLVQFALETHERLAMESYKLYDDALGVLTALREANIRLGLVTNGAPDTQRSKLQALGIEPYFDAIVVSGELGMAKPDPRVFEAALEQLDVEAGTACHVGDNLHTDVAGANAAGLLSFWINRHGLRRNTSDPEPWAEIATLSDLRAVLKLDARRTG